MTTKKRTFEEDMARLEELVEQLEQNELTLDESIKAFEEGTKLAATLMKTLERAQERVRKLTEAGQGEFELAEFGSGDEDE